MGVIVKKALKKKISLKNRLYITNFMTMIDVIVEAGYREDKGWDDSEDEQILIISEHAKKLTKEQLKLIKKYV